MNLRLTFWHQRSSISSTFEQINGFKVHLFSRIYHVQPLGSLIRPLSPIIHVLVQKPTAQVQSPGPPVLSEHSSLEAPLPPDTRAPTLTSVIAGRPGGESQEPSEYLPMASTSMTPGGKVPFTSRWVRRGRQGDDIAYIKAFEMLTEIGVEYRKLPLSCPPVLC